jgi:hypothetical protein
MGTETSLWGDENCEEEEGEENDKKQPTTRAFASDSEAEA